MNNYQNPSKDQWPELCERPVMESSNLESTVQSILTNVRLNGDQALKMYAKEFDGIDLENIEMDLRSKTFDIDQTLQKSIQVAKENVEQFHQAQLESPQKLETSKGVVCWRKSVPIERVGLYIPGGSAPLFSTLLMLVIPAQLAGCKEIIVCTPPQKDGLINEVIGWTCQFLGIEKVFLVGGAQAIGAMTYGTETVPKVDKLFGPGNQFVTAAKQLVQKTGVAIDMPAGPSEVLIIADQYANSEFVAADLLSQAEHGSDSQVVLLATTEDLLGQVSREIEKQLKELPRAEIAEKALQNSLFIQFDDLNTAVDFSNTYAPEHLILAVDNPTDLAGRITNAGSVFLGKWSCESAGDYASGTNHTLPTNGFARSYSGVSVDSFIKKITFQQLSEEGIQQIGPAIEAMAEAEQLIAHKNAVSVRLKNLQNA